MATLSEITAMLPLVEKYLTDFQKNCPKLQNTVCQICDRVAKDILDMTKRKVPYLEMYPSYVGISQLKKIVHIGNQHRYWILGCPNCGRFYDSDYECGQITVFDGKDGQPESTNNVWTVCPVTFQENGMAIYFGSSL